MNDKIKMGDKVVCIISGVKGIVIKQYFPTVCEEQTMIKCADGRQYHAPTKTYRRVSENENS